MTGTAVPALAQTWTGGGGTDNWFDPNNWNPAALPDATSDVDVAPGTVVISGGAADAYDVTVGAGGTIRVTGSGSSLATANETRLMDGTLIIEDGGQVTNVSGAVGGSVTVTGDDGSGNASTWINQDYFGVGDTGIGSVDILDGGKVIVNTGALIGSSDRGTVLVSGDDSAWEIDGGLSIYDGELNVEAGGMVSSDSGMIEGSVLTPAETTVSGPDSIWTNTWQLTVGNYGIGTLTIEDGGTVTSNQGFIGASADGVGTVTVTGDDSNWQITNSSLTLGNLGEGSLTIDDGALVFAAGGVWLGSAGSDAKGTLIVKGTGGNSGVLETSFLRGGDGTAEVTIDGGILRATGDSASFFYDFRGQVVTLGADGGTIDTVDHDIAIDPEITGAGRLTKDGTGTLTLTGDNSYAGGTTINEGTLQLGANGTSGWILGDVDNDGILAFNRSDDVSFGDTITGTGGIRQVGTGMTTITGDNSLLTGVSGVYDGILSVDGTLGGQMEVRGGRLQGTGRVGATTNFAGGTIAPGNSIGTITVAGDYVGSGGILEIEAVLGDDGSATDRLVVTGDILAGSTIVQVINLGGAGALTNEGIKIVDVAGASLGDFTLQGSHTFGGQPAVMAGAYMYRLYQGGVSTPADGDWYLRSAMGAGGTPLFQPGVPIYEAYGANLQSLNALPTLQQRVGNRLGNAGIDGGSGLWGRIEGKHSRFDNAALSASDLVQSIDSWKMQAGADGALVDSASGVLLGGFNVSYGTADSRIASASGDGTLATEGYAVGATLTWYDATGFYVDGQAQASRYSSDLMSGFLGTLTEENGGSGEAFSLEAGQRISLGESFGITPQVQMAYSNVRYDHFVDPLGSDVSAVRNDSLKMRLGMGLDQQAEWEGGRSQIYAVANASQEWLEGMQSSVAGTSIVNADERLWGELNLGASVTWKDDLTVYGEFSGSTPFRSFGNSYVLKGNVGLRAQF